MSLFDFNAAIVREPGRSVVDGLRAGDHAGPDYEGVASEHTRYVAALREAGLEVEALSALEAFPDSVFVEDPALVFAEGAILLRPGAPSRLGEADAIEPVLRRRFERVERLPRGFADGGDVLVTPEAVLIGLSGRTDREGARALAELLAGFGRAARVVRPPREALHLKSACAMVEEDTVLATPAMARSGLLGGLRILEVHDDEPAAANVLRVNDRVLAGAGYPRTLERLAARGLSVVPLPVAEFARLDAGLSCMSLRWKRDVAEA